MERDADRMEAARGKLTCAGSGDIICQMMVIVRPFHFRHDGGQLLAGMLPQARRILPVAWG